MIIINPQRLSVDEQVIFEYANKEASGFVRLLIMTLLGRLVLLRAKYEEEERES